MPKNTKKITDAELKKLGIKRVPTDAYHVGSYKYSNLNDALAEVERPKTKHKDISLQKKQDFETLQGSKTSIAIQLKRVCLPPPRTETWLDRIMTAGLEENWSCL